MGPDSDNGESLDGMKSRLHALIEQMERNPDQGAGLLATLESELSRWLRLLNREQRNAGRSDAAVEVHERHAEAIRCQQEAEEAYRRDLPALLRQAGASQRWVLYRGCERIAFGATKTELIRRARQLGIPENHVTIRFISRTLPSLQVEELPDV